MYKLYININVPDVVEKSFLFKPFARIDVVRFGKVKYIYSFKLGESKITITITSYRNVIISRHFCC